jgi:hypothetical protein
MKVSYDPKVEELARWVLDTEYKDYDERFVNVLSSVIQLAIEGWLEDRKGRK